MYIVTLWVSGDEKLFCCCKTNRWSFIKEDMYDVPTSIYRFQLLSKFVIHVIIIINVGKSVSLPINNVLMYYLQFKREFFFSKEMFLTLYIFFYDKHFIYSPPKKVNLFFNHVKLLWNSLFHKPPCISINIFNEIVYSPQK